MKSCSAGCGRPATSGPCPICGARVCMWGTACFDEHAVKHLVAAGMAEDNARLALVGDVDSPEEREALRRQEELEKGARS